MKGWLGTIEVDRRGSMRQLYATVLDDAPVFWLRDAVNLGLAKWAMRLGICPKLVIMGDDGGCYFPNLADHIG